MPSITPFLWFDTQAEEAARFYATIFADAHVGDVSRYPDGRAMSVSFRLNGQNFMALNGGPLYKFNESISMFISCDSQSEVDDLWEKLTADGGQPGRCGWLKDKFGLSWQVIPKQMGALLQRPGVVQAMMTMSKIDLQKLQDAAKS